MRSTPSVGTPATPVYVQSVLSGVPGTCGLQSMEPKSCGELAFRCALSSTPLSRCPDAPGPTCDATHCFFFPFSLQQFPNSMSAERPHRLHVKTLMLPVPFEASPDICLVLQVQLRESQGCSFRESISNVGCKERSFICKQV